MNVYAFFFICSQHNIWQTLFGVPSEFRKRSNVPIRKKVERHWHMTTQKAVIFFKRDFPKIVIYPFSSDKRFVC